MFMAALLCSGGHILLEDFQAWPDMIANSFAAALGLTFKRSNSLPSPPGDITGGYVNSHRREQFILRKGPIFTNVLLADEINRASPKTQSALLEAMQEFQVTLEGETQELQQPFVVIATQNPIEYEGTFPLPEAQGLDRFIARLSIGYPRLKRKRGDPRATRRAQERFRGRAGGDRPGGLPGDAGSRRGHLRGP